MRQAWMLFVFLSANLDATWLERKAEGWAWYEEKRQQQESDNAEPPPSASDRIAAARRELEEKLSLAVLEPTQENIEAYATEQKKWVDQSSLFAHTWQRMLLASPSLDHTNTSPVSQYGIQVHKQILQKKKEHLLAKLASDRGLFFFFNGECPVSRAFAKVVKAFGERYSWEVLPVTLDGVTLPEYPVARRDNGVAAAIDLSVLPALFVAEPKSGEIVPVSYGPASFDQIENNIMLQFQHLMEVDDA